jgi:uncharacterized protein (TIGR02284 family)
VKSDACKNNGDNSMNNAQLMDSTFEDLVHYLQDSRNGYMECADNVDSQLMKNLFIAFSKKRGEMLNELEDISEDKKIFRANGTLKGKMHQIFVNLKGFITGKNVDSIIAEIKRGENILIENYREILKDNSLPFNLKAILRNQMEQIENDILDISKKSLDFT